MQGPWAFQNLGSAVIKTVFMENASDKYQKLWAAYGARFKKTSEVFIWKERVTNRRIYGPAYRSA